MAFVTIEDLYGSCEIIVFDSCYNKSSNLLLEENIVVVEGRLSVREDEETKIVANKITSIDDTVVGEPQRIQIERKEKILTLDITNLEETTKAKLRGTIRFFSGDKNNIKLQIEENGEL